MIRVRSIAWLNKFLVTKLIAEGQDPFECIVRLCNSNERYID